MITHTVNTDQELIHKHYRKVTRINVPKKLKIISFKIEGRFESIENNRAKIWINTHKLARNFDIIYMAYEPINLLEFILTEDVKSEGRILKVNKSQEIELKADYNKEFKKFYLNNIIIK